MAINERPRGLNSFLGNDDFGFNPDELSKLVVPMVDIEPFIGKAIWATDTIAAVNAVGQFSFANLRVPKGERWLVTNFTVFGLAGAGETVQVNGTIQEPKDSPILWAGLSTLPIAGGQADAGEQSVASFVGRVILDVDESLGASVSIMTGPIDIIGNVRYYRLTF